tara:strand:+ start:591 stop:962 length:372 start_codon:yes stop_codon:yes gene_type:complete
MRYILAILLSLVSCSTPDVVYSEVSLDHFYDEWWELGDNSFFDEGVCFLLRPSDNSFWIHYPGYEPHQGVDIGNWVVEDDHIFLEDLYGYEVSIWLYGTCDDYTVEVRSGLFGEESNLYKCEF